MKIAIKGHASRGKEVIQLLESLGGINKWDQTGRCTSCAYYIDTVGNIYSFGICGYCGDKKIYTLEEFEKSFPFKIGDKVIHKEFNDFFEVISFDPESPYPYRIKGVCEFNTRSCVLTKWQPKMKEERFVTLTLEKAKEWYNKGGELKEIALQAFTEKELNSLPRSWEEFCKKHPIKEGESYINSEGKILSFTTKTARRDWNHICPSQKSAEAHLAMMQLEQLRNCWLNGWEPDWNDDQQAKYCIIHSYEFKIHILYETNRFLSFPTKEMAEEFLECFKDLIKQAGDLI